MKRTSPVIPFVAATTLFAGSTVADWEGKAITSTQEQSINGSSETMSFPKHSWERGEILNVLYEEKTGTNGEIGSIMKHSWERGQMLNLLREELIGQPNSDLSADSPTVIIYFDSTASEPGLPQQLGNTHMGRSIMLRHLEQARNNAES